MWSDIILLEDRLMSYRCILKARRQSLKYPNQDIANNPAEKIKWIY